MFSDIKDYITMACGGLLLVAFVVIYGLFSSNQSLKKKITVQEVIIQDQEKFLKLYRDKEEDSILEIEKKDKELIDLKKKRRENDKKEESTEFKEWSPIRLPTDAINIMRGK